jgi:hypothetical protein
MGPQFISPEAITEIVNISSINEEVNNFTRITPPT